MTAFKQDRKMKCMECFDYFLVLCFLSLAVVFKANAQAADAMKQFANHAPTKWQSVNLDIDNSMYVEGACIPYRYEITRIPEGANVYFEIHYDFTRDGIHAFDYLTSYWITDGALVAATGGLFADSPITSIPNNQILTNAIAIPDDVTIATDNLLVATRGTQYITLCGVYAGAHIVVAPAFSGSTDVLGNTQKHLAISVQGISGGQLAIAWGGHLAIGGTGNWPHGSGAGSILGSSFHQHGSGTITINLDHIDVAVSNDTVRTSADLELTKSASRLWGKMGDSISFTIVCTNKGPSDASGVMVQDLLPASLTYVSNSVGSAYAPATGIWTIGDLGAFASAKLVIAAQVNVLQGSIVNAAEVWRSDASDPDSTPGNGDVTEDDYASATTTIINPHVSITKTLMSPTTYAVQMNKPIVFQIAVTNRGDIALDVVPVDDIYLPHYLTYVSSVPATDDNQNNGTLRWNNVGPLAPGAGINLYATFIARAGTTEAGEINKVVTAPTTVTGVPVPPMTNSAIYRIDESIDVDNVSTGAFRFTPTGTVAHTVLAGSTNRVLVVGVSVNNTPEQPGVVTNVFYSGVPLILAGTRANVDKIVYIWVMTNPPEGTANVVVRCNKWSGEGFVVGVMTLRNVDQVNPYGAFASNAGESGNPTITGMSSVLGELIVDTVALQGTDLTAIGSGQVQRWVKSSQPIIPSPPRNYATGGGSIKAGAASVDMSWTVNHVASSNWAMGALAFRPHKTRATSQTMLLSPFNPLGVGQALILTATVIGTIPSPTPTGEVQFSVDGSAVGGSMALVAGVAKLELSGLAEGVHEVTAEYLGDTLFEGSTSALFQQTIGDVLSPAITAIRIEKEHAVVEWQGISNWFYTVDTTPSLSPLVLWTNLWPHVDIAGVNGPMSVTDTNKLSGARFYRVKMRR